MYKFFLHISRINISCESVVQNQQLTLVDTLQYEGTYVQILDWITHDTQRGSVALVKVLLSNHVTEEATWKA